MLRFYNALVFGPWTASPEFSLEELFLNTASGYFVTLFNCMFAHQLRGHKMWNAFLPRATCRNTIRLLGNLLVRVMGFPRDQQMTFEPKYTQEDSIEFFFGRIKCIKRGIHGCANTANAIQSTQLLHLQQSQKTTKVLLGNFRDAGQDSGLEWV